MEKEMNKTKKFGADMRKKIYKKFTSIVVVTDINLRML